MKFDSAQDGRSKPLRPSDCPTPEDAAALLGTSTATVRRWIRDGRLEAFRVGPRRLRIRPESLAAMMSPP